jgi:hypothetical protein
LTWAQRRGAEDERSSPGSVDYGRLRGAARAGPIDPHISSTFFHGPVARPSTRSWSA